MLGICIHGAPCRRCRGATHLRLVGATLALLLMSSGGNSRSLARSIGDAR